MHLRQIRSVARQLLNLTPTPPLPIIGLGDPQTQVWIPSQDKIDPDDPDPDNPHLFLAWCGWITYNGDHWLAVWRYKQKNKYFHPTPATEGRVISIPGSYKLNPTPSPVYQFNFASIGNAPFENKDITVTALITPNPTPNTNVSINLLSENPVFIRLVPATPTPTPLP